VSIISPSKYKSFQALLSAPKSKASSSFGIRDELISPLNAMLSVSASPKVILPFICASPFNSNLPKEPVVVEEPDISAFVNILPVVCVSVALPSLKLITPPLPKNRRTEGL